MIASKLQRIQEIERQLAQLKAELNIKQWEPVGGGWCIDPYGDAIEADSADDCRKFGTERPTKSQANKARDEMRVFNRLLAYRDEFDPDFIPNWDNGCWDKCYIFYQHGSWRVASTGKNHILCCVYFSKEVAEELVRKLNEGEVVLRNMKTLEP